jgi:tripartite motif-containing protein 71
VVVDTKGNLYVVASGNNRIQEFDGNGKLIMTWGSLGQNDGQFYNPTGMTVQFPQGNVYLVDTGNHRVQEFTNDGKFINKWELPAGTSVVSPITGIEIDVNSAGTIFLTDANAGTISVISASPATQK